MNTELLFANLKAELGNLVFLLAVKQTELQELQKQLSDAKKNLESSGSDGSK